MAVRTAAKKRDLGPKRDFYGYGPNPPDPKFPGNARIAVNINLNVEAGGEHNLLEGDNRSENALTDIGMPSYPGLRSPVVESVFDDGEPIGFRGVPAEEVAAGGRFSAGAFEFVDDPVESVGEGVDLVAEVALLAACSGSSDGAFGELVVAVDKRFQLRR